MMKQVEQVDTVTGGRAVLATFRLVGSSVSATWASLDYRDEVEANGLYLRGHGALRPADGPLFMDALDAAYQRSSLRSVVTR